MSSRLLDQSRKIFAGMIVFSWVFCRPGFILASEQLRFKPGFNLFSPKADVQLGRESSADADKKLPLVNDPELVRYVNDLGKRLAQFAPVNSDYPWTFKVVNSKEINAFALPGGFIYVNRGALEAAENEAQIAGVMAHEIGHVVMRHGTHQASQALLTTAPLMILGGALEQSSGLVGRLAELGIGFGVNSVLLKNSRSAESQADQVGTYILYHAGYDPHAMAQFFEIIEKKYPQQTLEFFSDHPNPENRIQKVDALIPELGPERKGKTDSPEFEAQKKRLAAMPPPPKGKQGPRSAIYTPPPPSSRMVIYEGQGFRIHRPENWEIQSSEGSVTLAPPGAMINGPQGESAQAYGASVTHYQPSSRDSNAWGLTDGTEQLVESLRRSNPNLRVTGRRGTRVSGRPALLTLLENDSPLEGQKEKDHLVTVRADDSLLAVIFIAPESSLKAYQPTFDAMLRSLELR